MQLIVILFGITLEELSLLPLSLMHHSWIMKSQWLDGQLKGYFQIFSLINYYKLVIPNIGLLETVGASLGVKWDISV